MLPVSADFHIHNSINDMSQKEVELKKQLMLHKHFDKEQKECAALRCFIDK